MAPIETGHMVIDEFASRFVYFYAGYWLAGHVFKFAEGVNFKSVPVILSGLFIWAMGNTLMVRSGYAAMPGLGLALGFIGAAAVVSSGVLLSKTRLAAPLRYAGENSIVIYLAFFLFMAATRSLLLKYQVITDLGSVALLTTAAGVVGPILLFWATRQTKLSLLFRRPAGQDWHRGLPNGIVTGMSHSTSLKPGDHLYLVDGSGYIFRAYHALPPLNPQERRPAGRRRAGLLQHAVEAAEGNAGQ